MKFLGSLAILLVVATAAQGQTAAPGSNSVQTHPVPRGVYPAVVRVIAPERDGMSLGSGTLVAVHGDHGLVATNWHVVRDAAGTLQVVFPDGFRSPARVLRADRVWDLAALAIWRPNVEPVALASQAPRPGEPLTIAGYGSGSYRAMTGACTQYVAPEAGQPFEMVELSVAARQGDSGGPIFNQRGELAGVLFGSGLGCTSGSYCGRVQRFLATIEGDFNRLAPNPLLIARQTPPPAATPREPSAPVAPDAVAGQPPSNYWTAVPSKSPPQTALPPPPSTSPPVVAAIATEESVSRASASLPRPQPALAGDPSSLAPAGQAATAPSGVAVARQPAAPTSAEATPDLTGSTLVDQLKTFLAAIGAFAILFHGIRVLASEPPSKTKKKKKS